MDILLPICLLCLSILLLILALRRFNQPYLVAYILAGILMKGCGIFPNEHQIINLGEFGVLLLMFFLGVEIEIPDNRSVLLEPLIAQSVRMFFSLACALGLTLMLHWSPGNFLVLAILLMFNSTAVVSEFLTRNGELHTPTGRLVLNILLLQDILVAPVCTLFQSLDGSGVSWSRLAGSIAGCLLLFVLLRSIRNRNMVQWKHWTLLTEDHDLQVFLAACICLGCALLGSVSGLSAPLGAFAAGLWLGKNEGFSWLTHVLKPFRTFFVGLFFVSIGLSLDLSYLSAHWLTVLSITFGLLLINSLISALVFRLLGHRFSRSLEAGALLSQTGELGLLACAVAYRVNLVDADFYKICIAVTGVALLLSTAWMSVLRRLTAG